MSSSDDDAASSSHSASTSSAATVMEHASQSELVSEPEPDSLSIKSAAASVGQWQGKAAADREPDATLAAAAEGLLSANDERRLRKRAAAVAAVKRLTPSYTFKRAGRPSTPDPSDLSISKRRWEASVQKWRRELRTVEL